MIVSTDNVIGLISGKREPGHQREAVPLRINPIAMELNPRVGDGVARIVVVSRNNVEEVGLDVMSGVTHIGVAHNDGRALVGLCVGQDVIAELPELRKHGLHVRIRLGVAAAVVGVHVGDIHVDDNVVRCVNGHHIMTEALLDTGIGSIVQIAFLIIILYICLAGSTCGRCTPKEIQSIRISDRAKCLSKSYSSTISSVRIIRQSGYKLRVILKVFACGNNVPAKVIRNARHRCGST